MGYGTYLKNLLEPLRVYQLEDGSVNGGELESIGALLDRESGRLEELAGEMISLTGAGYGLEGMEKLLGIQPFSSDLEDRRQAVAALLRIGAGSFTLPALNGTLAGCGINAVVRETGEPYVVEVYFPEVIGQPDGFDQVKARVEGILPCHLEVRYIFWYATWEGLEGRFAAWGDLEAPTYQWQELERMVEPEEDPALDPN